MTSSTASATSQPAANKAVALAFIDMAFNQHKPEHAASLYFGEPYIQHNPQVEDGAVAFCRRFMPFLQAHPCARATVKGAVADDDLVAVHLHFCKDPDDLGEAVTEWFRFEAGRMVEHWDVVQLVPAESLNHRSMF